MSAESLLLFAIGINKFKVTNWQEKKPELLKLIELDSKDIVECQTDYYKQDRHILTVLLRFCRKIWII